ncbi:MAG: membrane protein [Saprospiraceae bacterium]|nr:MAG: membrane protein [Saprospiraceae bacterium]
MKKLTLLLVLGAFAMPLMAQHEAIFSQFFYNKVYANPAAAAAEGIASVSAFHRQQWSGLEGAPQTSAVLFSTPAFGKRVGLGLTLLNDQIGFFNNSFANVAYAYRIPLGRGILAAGIQGTYALYHTDWGEAKTSSAQPDPITETDPWVSSFNVGAGLHYQSRSFFAGVSVPYFLRQSYTGLDDADNPTLTQAAPHVFITAGGIVPLSQWASMRPAVQARFVKGAPTSTDAHLSFGLLRDNRLWVGLTYRWSFSDMPAMGDAVVLQTQFGVSERLRIGAAYDISLGSLLWDYGRTYEFMLEYSFLPPTAGVRNPRYF